MLRLQPTYHNVGPQALILPVFFRISKLIVTAAPSPPRVIVPHDFRREDNFPEFDTPEPNRAFEIIPAGGISVSKMDFPVYVVVHDPSAHAHEPDLRGRKVSLRWELDHLVFSRPPADKLAKRWATHGYLDRKNSNHTCHHRYSENASNGCLYWK